MSWVLEIPHWIRNVAGGVILVVIAVIFCVGAIALFIWAALMDTVKKMEKK
jgi:hypothetical protein